MAEHRQYQTAQALRTALETRLSDIARSQGTDIQRLRRRVAFDRFLARLFSAEPKDRYPRFLKGGYAMELRIRRARATKDIEYDHYGKCRSRRCGRVSGAASRPSPTGIFS